MPPDLRSRLRRIQEMRKGGPAVPVPCPPARVCPGPVAGTVAAAENSSELDTKAGTAEAAEGPPAGTAGKHRSTPVSGLSGVSPLSRSPPFGSEWSSAAYLSLKRTVSPEPFPAVPAGLPGDLNILIPDLIPYCRDQGAADVSDLLFFDLETTGLSGGAGTTAFLAAFGRFVRDDPAALDGAAASPGAYPASAGTAASDPLFSPARLQVTQYLLLDYPGEGDFLEAALSEFRAGLSGGPPLIVTYNGKSFDAQILKTRCLMNGLKPPVYYHADLLHPARRLWKRVLPNCSQGEIETTVLGLDRTGDTPGALAPDIWFSFLKTGETGELLKICDHNVRDITGLAALFAALARIAEDPAAAIDAYRLDAEALALRYAAKNGKTGNATAGTGAPGADLPAEQRLAEKLLDIAADRAYPRAAALRAQNLFRRGNAAAGRNQLRTLAEGDYPGSVKAAALRSLAIDAEWRLNDPPLALAYTDRFLRLNAVRIALVGDIMKRRERLLKKTAHKQEDAMNIRLMTAEDYGKVYELWKTAPGVGLRSLDDTEQGIRKFLDRNPGASFVAEQDGELVGAILGGHDGRRGSIYHTAVKDGLRGRGIGKALVKAVEAALGREGITKIGLVSIKTNIGANRFWKALDYNVREDLAYRDKSLNPENL